MATKYGVKLVFNLNGNLPFADLLANTPSSDPIYRPEFPEWSETYNAYLTKHSWEGTDPIKIKRDTLENGNVSVTYVIDNATAENVETLQRLHIWSSDLNDIFRFREEYYSSHNIQMVSREVVALTV